jgi:dTDP-4-amino-4,6-dideoxygalactose transaminase
VENEAQRPEGRDEFLVFGSPLIEEPEIAEIVDCLRSGWIGTGPKVSRFERMLEQYTGAPHARCVSSGTAALLLALKIIGVGPGDEVIVPAMTFVASANAVEHTGASTVLVDCEPVSGLIDPDCAEAAITARTKALMPVHLAGRPVDMDRINALRDRHGIAIVEDAAHALGAEWRGRRVGSHGNLTAFSFYVTKNITTIEGGCIATDDHTTANRIEQLALHGLSLGAWQRYADASFRHYEVVEPGFKFNMTDVQASLGIHQLPRLDEWIDRRASAWAFYDQSLQSLPLTTPLGPSPQTRHARHLYQVLVEDEAPVGRDELLDLLVQRRIGTGVHYRGVHLHPYYRARYALEPSALPVASDISNRTLSLPLSPKVSERDQEDVVAALGAALESRS